jgi:hypothetical protein
MRHPSDRWQAVVEPIRWETVGGPVSPLFGLAEHEPTALDGCVVDREFPSKRDGFVAILERDGQPYIEAAANVAASEGPDPLGGQFCDVQVDPLLGQVRVRSGRPQHLQHWKSPEPLGTYAASRPDLRLLQVVGYADGGSKRHLASLRRVTERPSGSVIDGVTDQVSPLTFPASQAHQQLKAPPPSRGQAIHPDGARVRLPRSRRRLVQPQGTQPSDIDHDGHRLLH